MAQPVRNAIWKEPSNLKPYEKVRLVGPAVLTPAVVGALTWVASFAGMWWVAGQTDLLGGTTPEFSLLQHARYASETFAHFAMVHTRPFADDAKAYGDWAKQLPFMLLDGKALLALLPSAALSTLIFRKMWKPFTRASHASGMQLHTGSDALAKAKIAVEVLNKGKNKGFLPLHPDLHLSRQAWSTSAMVLGASGSGKTSILNHLLYGAMKDRHRMFLTDVKGDFSWVLAKINEDMGRPADEVAAFSMFDRDGVAWDMGRDFNLVEDCTVFINGYIPESKDPMWSSGARSIARLAPLSLLMEYKEAMEKAKAANLPEPEPWHPGHLAFRLLQPMSVFYRWALLYDPMTAATMGADYATNATVRSFEVTMRTFMQPLVALGRAWGETLPGESPRRRVSLRAFVEGLDNPEYTGPRVLLSRGNEQYEQMGQGLLRAMHGFLTKATLALSEGDRTLLILLDEFISMGKVETILDGLEKGRSKGLVHVILTQSEAALTEVYGDSGRDRISINTTIKVLGLTPDAATANRMASSYGDQQVQIRQVATTDAMGNTQVSKFEDDTAKVLPPELLSSAEEMGPQGKSGVRAIARIGKDLYHLTWPFVSRKLVPRAPKNLRYQLAAWLTGDKVAPFTDYVPFPKQPTVAPAAPVDAPVGTDVREVEQVEGNAAAVELDAKPKLDLAALFAERTGLKSRVVTETVFVDAQRGSQEYTEATIEAVELQRAQEIRGDWQDQGEINEGAEMILEALSEHVLDTVLPGAMVLMTGLKIAEGLEAPSRNVEHMLDSVGDVRTVTIVAPKVSVTRQKITQTHERER